MQFFNKGKIKTTAVLFLLLWAFVSGLFSEEPKDCASVKKMDNKLNALKTDKPPVIDAKMDDAYLSCPVALTMNTDSGGGKNFAFAKVRVLWDAKNLYIFAQIKDDKVTGNTRLPCHQQDGFEVFIDEKNDKSCSYQPDDRVYMVSWSNIRCAYRGAKDTDFTSAVAITEDGWNCEMQIPLYLAHKPEDILGIEFACDDTDSKNVRHTQKSWNQINNAAWNHPIAFGTLILK